MDKCKAHYNAPHVGVMHDTFVFLNELKFHAAHCNAPYFTAALEIAR